MNSGGGAAGDEAARDDAGDGGVVDGPGLDDAGLVGAARAGDTGALDTLLRRHHPRVRALCLRLTGDPADADDACQEALLALVRGLPSFDGRSSFATWAYRVTTNTCLDELRRRRRRPVPGLPDEADAPDGRYAVVDGRSAGVDGADAVAERVDIDAALAGLAPEFRAAVVLRDLCQFSYAEISETVGVPLGTVRSRIARGRAALLAVLAGNPSPIDRRPTS